MATFKNAQQAASLIKARVKGKHSHATIPGFKLVIDDSKAAWEFHYTSPTKVTPAGKKARPEMGLGAADGQGALTLADATTKATDARALLNKGIDPLEHKQAGKPRLGVPTVKQAGLALIECIKGSWKGDGSSNSSHDSWRRTFGDNGPCTAILSKRVDAVTLADVASIVVPLWPRPKAKTILMRLAKVFDVAMGDGHRDRALGNPADLDELKSRLSGEHETEHHVALPWQEIPATMAKLASVNTVAARAVRFCILSGLRPGEAVRIRRNMIDEEGVLTIPAHIMKKSKNGDHSLKLFRHLLAIVAECGHGADDGYLFKSDSKGGRKRKNPTETHVSRDSLRLTLQRVAPLVAGELATPHGTARAGLETWTADNHPELSAACNAALHHVVGSRVLQAYRRTTFFDARTRLYELWGDYLTGQTAPVAADGGRLASELQALAASNSAELQRLLSALAAAPKADDRPALRLVA